MAPQEYRKGGRYQKALLTPTERALLGNISSRRLNAKELAALLGTSESAIHVQIMHLKEKFPGQVNLRRGLGYMFTGVVPGEEQGDE